MGLVQQDHVECKHCGHAWFKTSETFALAKTSTYDNPIVLRKHIMYYCEHCERAAYSTTEEVN